MRRKEVTLDNFQLFYEEIRKKSDKLLTMDLKGHIVRVVKKAKRKDNALQQGQKTKITKGEIALMAFWVILALAFVWAITS